MRGARSAPAIAAAAVSSPETAHSASASGVGGAHPEGARVSRARSAAAAAATAFAFLLFLPFFWPGFLAFFFSSAFRLCSTASKSSANSTSLNRSRKLHTSNASPAKGGFEMSRDSGMVVAFPSLVSAFPSRPLTLESCFLVNASWGVSGPGGASLDSHPSTRTESLCRNHRPFVLSSATSRTAPSASSTFRRSLATRTASFRPFSLSLALSLSSFSAKRSAAFCVFSAASFSFFCSRICSAPAIRASFSARSALRTASLSCFSASRFCSFTAFSSAFSESFSARTLALAVSLAAAFSETLLKCSTFCNKRSITLPTSAVSLLALTCAKVSPGLRSICVSALRLVPAPLPAPPGCDRLAFFGAAMGTRP
mmetsp:Transcript_11576/g.38303  ORF Transcript_11576/g.38303 Transcript_11576/m.38303 type:complete len:369 (+) Transcript_11576:3589-4695(+)